MLLLRFILSRCKILVSRIPIDKAFFSRFFSVPKLSMVTLHLVLIRFQFKGVMWKKHRSKGLVGRVM